MRGITDFSGAKVVDWGRVPNMSEERTQQADELDYLSEREGVSQRTKNAMRAAAELLRGADVLPPSETKAINDEVPLGYPATFAASAISARLIGNLLDRWEMLPNDLKSDPGIDELGRAIRAVADSRGDHG